MPDNYGKLINNISSGEACSKKKKFYCTFLMQHKKMKSNYDKSSGHIEGYTNNDYFENIDDF